MKKPAIKYYDAARQETKKGVVFTCKCWICGQINDIEYRRSAYGDLRYYPTRPRCEHVPGWRHDPELTWLQISFKAPPKPRKRRSPR
jgi:hypothetical protein